MLPGWPEQDHTNAWRLDFLPYHFLLVSTGEQGILRYQVCFSPHAPLSAWPFQAGVGLRYCLDTAVLT